MHVNVAPGAKLTAGGHDTAALSSVTVNGSVNVTFDVFVNEYV